MHTKITYTNLKNELKFQKIHFDLLDLLKTPHPHKTDYRTIKCNYSNLL